MIFFVANPINGHLLINFTHRVVFLILVMQYINGGKNERIHLGVRNKLTAMKLNILRFEKTRKHVSIFPYCKNYSSRSVATFTFESEPCVFLPSETSSKLC